MLPTAVAIYANNPIKPKEESCCSRKNVAITTGVADAFILITGLVIAILGLTGVFSALPPAASYALIGVSSLIAVSWLAMIAYGSLKR